MGNHQGGAALHSGFQRGLHHALAVGVQGAGGFVQQKQRRVFQHGSGDGNALALTTRQAHTFFAQEGLVTLWQLHDELVSKRGLGRSQDFGVSRLGLAIADVVHG